MKKLTLDETWDLCLKMFKWISRQQGDVGELKSQWLRKHGFVPASIDSNCFFCEYHHTHKRKDWGKCNCPARKIDKDFDCKSAKYDYTTKPRAFYKKLVALNKIRLAKKSGA